MDSILQSVGDWFSNGIGGFFYNTCYMLGAALCWIIGILDKLFSVMSGQTKVRYEGKVETLLDVFVGNSIVEKIYWAMALIGIVLCFVFAIIAVARKAVDSSDKMRQSMGGILTSLFKGIIIIVSMTFIFNAVLSLSNKLLTQINYAFNHADSLGEDSTIEFTDEQYAAMARVLDTVANYSLNPSYNSRYNLNSCYNEIRADLQYLMQEGVFDFHYDTEEYGNTWQSALQSIVNAADPSTDQTFDVYDDTVGDALLECMNIMQTDSSFGPLKSYTRKYSDTNTSVPLDRLVFLSATMRAAENSSYNQNASMEDPLRGAYYTGEKNIYDNEQVSKDFKMSDINYLVIYIVAFKLIWDLGAVIADCAARIFNMVFLYLVAPPFIGVMPLDDGGKFKQWITAFVVQCFGVFGTIIAMRVLLIFIPIIVNSDLVLFENDLLNMAGKVVLILVGMSTSKRASSVITGILADNAGYQAILGSNMGDSIRKSMDHVRNRITGLGELGNWGTNGKGLASAFSSNGKNDSSQGGGGSRGSSSGSPKKQPKGTKDTGKGAVQGGENNASNPVPVENKGANNEPEPVNNNQQGEPADPNAPPVNNNQQGGAVPVNNNQPVPAAPQGGGGQQGGAVPVNNNQQGGAVPANNNQPVQGAPQGGGGQQGGPVPVDNNQQGGAVPVNNNQQGGAVPVNNNQQGGAVPVNNNQPVVAAPQGGAVPVINNNQQGGAVPVNNNQPVVAAPQGGAVPVNNNQQGGAVPVNNNQPVAAAPQGGGGPAVQGGAIPANNNQPVAAAPQGGGGPAVQGGAVPVNNNQPVQAAVNNAANVVNIPIPPMNYNSNQNNNNNNNGN